MNRNRAIKAANMEARGSIVMESFGMIVETNRVQPRRSIVIQRGNSYSHFAPHANNGAAGIDATHNGGRVVYVALPELRA